MSNNEPSNVNSTDSLFYPVISASVVINDPYDALELLEHEVEVDLPPELQQVVGYARRNVPLARLLNFLNKEGSALSDVREKIIHLDILSNEVEEKLIHEGSWIKIDLRPEAASKLERTSLTLDVGYILSIMAADLRKVDIEYAFKLKNVAVECYSHKRG